MESSQDVNNAYGTVVENEFPVVAKAREAFASGKTLPIEFRRRQLQSLLNLLNDKRCREKICDAVYNDLRRCTDEGICSEIVTVKMEIVTILNNLEKYLAAEHLPRRWHSIGDTASIRCEPRGVVLVVGTWNYPFYMTLLPVVGAIAAGNCVIIKPSEISHHSAKVMFELLPRYLDRECYNVVLGDADATKSLLKNRFDYIFFTGSQNVGKAIYQAAADNLTPVTLELGGKCPAYIDDTACSKMAVKRILWGKNINLGQSCLAPDYVICSKKVQEAFVSYTKEIFDEWYQDRKNLQQVESLGRIINKSHFQRLKTLLDKTKGGVLLGGRSDEKDLWIEPTLIGNVKRDDILMEEEIFGPILPIVTVNSADEAISFINSTERPLAVYIFSKNEETANKMVNSTVSGGVVVNDVMLHSIDMRLPFGGRGKSGLGQYHGKYSIQTFSHQRSVLRRGLTHFSEKMMEVRYPPFKSWKTAVQENAVMLLDYMDVEIKPTLKYFLVFLLGYFFHMVATSDSS